jgi:stage V sporulation protein B
MLTGVSLLMRGIGMAFQSWLALSLGASGLGLYELTLSLYNLCATLAISGIRFTATRLVAEELGGGRSGSIRAAMRRCLAYGGVFGILSGALLQIMAEALAFLWIGDARMVLSLRIAALSMPCISLGAAISGYFTACGRVGKAAAVHLAEQLMGIALIMLLLPHAPVGDMERRCAAVTLGRTGADVFSVLLMSAVYLHDRRRHYRTGESGEKLSLRMLRLAVPLALSAYTRSALTTLQQMLVPRGLRSAGLTADMALAGYGVVQGMVMPLLFFPSCLLGAAADLIVPELTAAQVGQKQEKIENTAGKLVHISLYYSLAVSAVLFFCADLLGELLYHSREAARFLRLLAPLVPIMYTDIAVDGCLKGLGQQVWSMGINIVEAALGLLLMLFLLPRYGLAAYLALLYFSEAFNLSLSCLRLICFLKSCRPEPGTGGQMSRTQQGKTAGSPG